MPGRTVPVEATLLRYEKGGGEGGSDTRRIKPFHDVDYIHLEVWTGHWNVSVLSK